MAEPSFRPRSRTRRAEGPANARDRRRRRRRPRNPLVAIAAVLVVLVAAGLMLGFTTGAFGGELDDSTCSSCHTNQPETPLFSHKAHAADRACSACHESPKHAGLALVRARVGLADPNAARVTSGDLKPAQSPGSALKGHREVVCSTCHDMRRQSCGACHDAPKPAHYRAACATCHKPQQPFVKVSLTHPTFGAHSVAPAACDACHAPNAKEKPACRRCHNNTCGRGVKTMAGCLECHRRGETTEWLGPVGN